MSRRTKWILIATAAIVIVGGASAGVFLSRRGTPPTPVETASVGRRDVVQTVHGTGRIQPVTQVKISADVSAKITKLAVKEGQWVERGALLLELDRDRYVAAVESAEATLRAAEASVNLARENMHLASKDNARTKSLYDEKLESPAGMDRAATTSEVEKARHKSAVDQAAQAEAALKQARDALAKTRIYAPMSGTVSKLNKQVGEIALGSQFQEDVVMVISNLAGMEAQVNVDENDIVNVALGNHAKIEVDALPDDVLEGTVTEIANTAKVTGEGTTDQKTEFQVKIGIIDPHQKLRPGMTATADIVTKTHEKVIAVPIQCVAVRTPDQILHAGDAASEANGGMAGQSERGAGAQSTAGGSPSAQADKPVAASDRGAGSNQPAADGSHPAFVPDKNGFVTVVWVIEKGKAIARPVTTGIQGASDIEITKGLEEGETIVVGSYRAISRDLHQDAVVTVDHASRSGGPTGAGAAGAH